jgi:hypothetical protein
MYAGFPIPLPNTNSTAAIRMAFEILKYRPFHGRMMDEMPHLYPLWTEALEARYLHTGKDYTRADYDKLFDGFNVSCNIPGTLVAAELIMAYPEAKVVVSTRDVDRWQQSMRQSVDSAVSWKSFDWLAPWDPVCFLFLCSFLLWPLLFLVSSGVAAVAIVVYVLQP